MIKNFRLIQIMKELKSIVDAIEGINKIKELETEIIIESTKKKPSAIEKENIDRRRFRNIYNNEKNEGKTNEF